jgi:subtilisin family serine protease
MNRNNFWMRFIIAGVAIGIAAIAGEVSRWDFSANEVFPPIPPPPTIERSAPKVRVIPFDTGGNSAQLLQDAELLIRFKPGVSREQIETVLAEHNDEILDRIEAVSGLYAVDDLDNANPQDDAEEYSRLSDLVLYAEPNNIISLGPSEAISTKNLLDRGNPGDAPNDPMFADQWALNNEGQDGGKSGADIRALDAWKKTKGSTKVVIAVLDSGVDYTHADLVSNIWTRPESVPEYEDEDLGTIDDYHGFNSDDAIADPMDENGHGTHCAGVIGAEGDNNEGIAGINWKVEIMPLKFLGSGGFGSTKNAIEAINYVIDRKKAGVNVRVISASWGSTSKSKALEDVIRIAGEEGILFVAAAGNDSSNNDKRPHYPSNYDLPNVISVAALDRNDQLASFSNYGEKTVHIAAPGKDIVSTWLSNAYRDASGTSMATPQIAGVAGLILAKQPKISVGKLREKILASVDKLVSLNGKVSSGGRINAAKAVGN